MLMAAASEASAVAFLHNTFVAASVFHVQDLTCRISHRFIGHHQQLLQHTKAKTVILQYSAIATSVMTCLISSLKQ